MMESFQLQRIQVLPLSFVLIGFGLMAPASPRVVVKVDLKKRPWQQTQPLHNRWHPEIPSVAEVKTGELFRVEMVDWTGGAVKEDGSADIKSIDLSTEWADQSCG